MLTAGLKWEHDKVSVNFLTSENTGIYYFWHHIAEKLWFCPQQ